jgi:uncharacterized UPF0146 family protein
VRDATRDALVSRLSDYDCLVEVGVCTEPSVAAALARAGLDVTATDIQPRETPPGVAFAVDDVTDPERALYADADAVYARNLPPELHRPTATLARAVDADFLFTTLGGDPPTVPVARETIPGETLFVARLNDRHRDG